MYIPWENERMKQPTHRYRFIPGGSWVDLVCDDTTGECYYSTDGINAMRISEFEENPAFEIERLTQTKENAVEHPSHYNQAGIEAITYIKDSLGLEGFTYHCEGTTKKYLHRFRYKNKPIEDLKKARQYLDWLIETMEELKEEEPNE